ncbi:MAG: DUF1326 domain-containing protein [Actinomycetota bacterium]
MTGIPGWRVSGDWFDVCSCTIPCPCTFAQPPNVDACEGIVAYHIREGHYGEVRLDGLIVVGVSRFEGNLWAGAKVTAGGFMDERADQRQREALLMIWSGQAGGFPAVLAERIGEVRGFEFAPVELEIADGLAYWRVEVPGRITARGEPLTGPTAPAGALVQVLNPPGSEVGPGGPATYGRATAHRVDAFGFSWEWAGRSSKHIPFDWSGPAPSA